MSTFIIRFHGSGPRDFRGEARDVRTGETLRFANAEELVRFLEEMNALRVSSAAAPSLPPLRPRGRRGA